MNRTLLTLRCPTARWNSNRQVKRRRRKQKQSNRAVSKLAERRRGDGLKAKCPEGRCIRVRPSQQAAVWTIFRYLPSEAAQRWMFIEGYCRRSRAMRRRATELKTKLSLMSWETQWQRGQALYGYLL